MTPVETPVREDIDGYAAAVKSLAESVEAADHDAVMRRIDRFMINQEARASIEVERLEEELTGLTKILHDHGINPRPKTEQRSFWSPQT